METPTSPSSAEPSSGPRWTPLTRDQRRVLGVLIEKSKTTPDVYPMTINAIKNGCNQKSNRSPLMELEDHRVEEILYELRQIGCVIEVHANGRVSKFKHQAYDWLGVSKEELSVMTELLLRGAQSIGDLRARSARMEKSLDSLEALRPILASLKSKELILELTPAGRGQVVSHNLYQPNELEKVQRQYESFAESEEETDEPEDDDEPTRPVGASSDRSAEASGLSHRVEALEAMVQQIQDELSELRRLLE